MMHTHTHKSNKPNPPQHTHHHKHNHKTAEGGGGGGGYTSVKWASASARNGDSFYPTDRNETSVKTAGLGGEPSSRTRLSRVK